MVWFESRRWMEVRPHSMSTEDSSRSQITGSRSLARALIKKFRSTSSSFHLAFILVTLLGLLLSSSPASAHQPVTLGSDAKRASTSPVLIDGTISFANYASFTKAEFKAKETKETKKSSSAFASRFLRFQLKTGDQLALQYLIPDTPQMSQMKKSALPRVFLTSPTGERERIAIKERTSFFEPYSKTNYFYLSRLNRTAEAGTYSVEVRSNRPASVVIAIGSSEVPGDVLEFGSSEGQCPKPIQEQAAIQDDVARQLVGMKEEVAKLCADLNDWGYRVGERDGEFFALTRDYRIDRITVSITKGIITDVQVG